MFPSLVLDKDLRVVERKYFTTQLIKKLDIRKGQKPNAILTDLVAQKLMHIGKWDNQQIDDWKVDITIEPSLDYYHIEFQSIISDPLSQNLDKYKLLVESANDIIYETDVDGYFVYVNPKAIELTGFSHDELIGQRYLYLIREDWRERVMLFYQNQMAETIRSTYLEFPVIKKDGSELWVGQNVQLLESDSGILGIMAVARNITSHQEAQNTLKLSEEKYRSIIQNLQFGLMEVDLDGNVIFANEAMFDITGYTKTELIGNKGEDLLLNDEAVKIIDREHQNRGMGIASAYELPIKNKNNSIKWALISGAPKYDLAGNITGSIGIHVDITDRIESEKQLKETQIRLDKYKVGIESLNSVTSNLSLSFDDQIKKGLLIANQYLGLDLAIISEIEGQTYEVLHFVSRVNNGLNVGDTFDLSITLCELVQNQDVPFYVEDMTNSKLNDHPSHSAFGIESYIGIQYAVNGKARGTVNFSSSQPRVESFDSYDLEFITLFAKWVGYTITNKENQLKLEADKNYLSAINGFVTSLLKDESIEEIAWEIAENVIDKFGYEDCVIYILNEDEKKLDQLAAYGPKQSKDRKIADPITLNLNEGIVGSVAVSGEAEIVSDTSKDDRYVVDDAQRLSEITVPIIADGKVIGVIDSEHPKKDFFKEEHLNTLTTIANLASNRLKNAIAKNKQEKAEQELQESELKLRNILHNAIDAVITINDRGMVTEWNRQAEVIFGFSAEETIGKPLTSTIIPPQHHHSHNKGMEHFHKTGEGPVLNQKIEITAMRKSGEEFPIEMAIIPVESKGTHSFTAFLSDITLQKQVKDEMEKALQKERELNELKSRFVSMTSHEFRTPLTTIKQNIDLVSFKLEKNIPEQAGDYKKYINRVESEIKRVTDLMNDILMLGKIDAGKFTIKLKEVDFASYVQQIVEKMSENRADGRKMKMTIAGVPRPVHIDASLFDHVLNNLVSNAFKYSEGAANPELYLNFNELDSVRIRVKDFGIGIPKKDHKSLFQSFYRATNVKNIQGSGLGLSIVREFTIMHGGEIDFKSEDGKGTEFILDIPYNSEV